MPLVLQSLHNFITTMKTLSALVILSLITLTLSGIIPGLWKAPNPNDIFKKVQFLPLSPLDYAGTHQPIQSLKYRSILVSSTPDTTVQPISSSLLCSPDMHSIQYGDVVIQPGDLLASTLSRSRSIIVSEKSIQQSRSRTRVSQLKAVMMKMMAF